MLATQKREELIRLRRVDWIWNGQQQWLRGACVDGWSVMEHLSLAICFQRPGALLCQLEVINCPWVVEGANLLCNSHDGHRAFIQKFNHANHEGYANCWLLLSATLRSTWLLENLYQRWRKRRENDATQTWNLPGITQPPLVAWWSRSKGKANECLCVFV